MKTKFNGVLTLFIALVVQISFAQVKTISGTVSDVSGVLPGVSVIIEGTKTGTETDFDGKYQIKANEGDVLIFRYLGYTTLTVTTGSSEIINVTLKEGSEMLNEITIGLGVSNKEKAIGYAVQKVSGEDINSRSCIIIRKSVNAWWSFENYHSWIKFFLRKQSTFIYC